MAANGTVVGIIGGGFAGVACAKKPAGSGMRIELFDTAGYLRLRVLARGARRLLGNIGMGLTAFVMWAEEFYFRPHHRSARLLEPAVLDTPRIDRDRKG